MSAHAVVVEEFPVTTCRYPDGRVIVAVLKARCVETDFVGMSWLTGACETENIQAAARHLRHWCLARHFIPVRP